MSEDHSKLPRQVLSLEDEDEICYAFYVNINGDEKICLRARGHAPLSQLAPEVKPDQAFLMPGYQQGFEDGWAAALAWSSAGVPSTNQGNEE